MNELWLSRRHEGQAKHSLYDCVRIGLCLIALFGKLKKSLWIIKFEEKKAQRVDVGNGGVYVFK